jgi:sec-independent protein translocase protein TatA
MEALSPGHIIVLAVVAAVLFFGWRQLPDMSRSLGRSLRIFKTEIKGLDAPTAARQPAATELGHAPVNGTTPNQPMGSATPGHDR